MQDCSSPHFLAGVWHFAIVHYNRIVVLSIKLTVLQRWV